MTPTDASPRSAFTANSPANPGGDIARAIHAATAQGGPALVAYVTAGFPTKAGFIAQLQAVAAGADVIEIGVPFTDPMADGVTIQRSSAVALEQGVSLRWILEELAVGPRLSAPLLLMSYLNPLLAFGLDKLPQAAARAGVSGFIVPDMPVDESDLLREPLAAQGVALVQMVTPVTQPERLRQVCAVGTGFIYAVTMTGVTGANVAVPADVTDYLDRVRQQAKVPVCAGFGIRKQEQVRALKDHVDGVIVGSALVEVLERGGDATTFLRGLRA